MEPDASSRPVPPPPAEWRALSRLRERVEDAVREVERLRAQNASLARRVAELQEGLGADEAPGLAFPGGADPDALRAKIQGFIDAIDEVLAAPEPEPDAGPDGDGASADFAEPDNPPRPDAAPPAP
jgi:hypothetical protein